MHKQNGTITNTMCYILVKRIFYHFFIERVFYLESQYNAEGSILSSDTLQWRVHFNGQSEFYGVGYIIGYIINRGHGEIY